MFVLHIERKNKTKIFYLSHGSNSNAQTNLEIKLRLIRRHIFRPPCFN